MRSLPVSSFFFFIALNWSISQIDATFYYGSVLLLTINCVITLSKWLWNHLLQANGSTVNCDNVTTKFYHQ